MFGRGGFGRAMKAMGGGVPKGKLVKAMLEILGQLPVGTSDLKNTIVSHMGFMAAVSSSRDINSAWNDAKKKAMREFPGRFILDDRDVLHWNDGSKKTVDKDISASNFKKLNDIAEIENCSVNEIVTKILKSYRKKKTTG